MNKKTILAFFMGATVGSIATWKFLKTKYELYYEEEDEELFEDDAEEDTDEAEPEPINEIDEKPDLSIYTAKLKEQGYLQDVEEGGTDDMEKPYVISQDKYGGTEDYDLYSYTYYADKVLADENNEPIEDVDHRIGLESLNHFGEYGDDSVYVRNDKLKADYEILLDDEKYEILFPRPMEDE